MAFIALYETVISWIIWHTRFGSDKLVHVFAGMMIWLLVGLVSRRPLASFWPLAAIVAAETGNEVVDYIHAVGWTLPETAQDVFFTLFWPFAISFAMRRCRWL